jgi:hypothetical protein
MFLQNDARFGLLNNIAPGPAPSTVLSRCPLMSLVALKIVPARNCSHDSQNGHVAPPKQSRDPEDNPSSVGPEFELKLRGLRAKTNLKITISDNHANAGEPQPSRAAALVAVGDRALGALR